MGSVQSQVSTEVAASYTNVVNNVVNSVVNSSDLNCTTQETFSLSTGIIPASGGFPAQNCPFSLTDGSLTVGQGSALSCSLNSTNINSISSQIKNRLETETQQWIQQNFTNFQGWLESAFSTQAGQTTTISKVSNDIANSVSNNISNQCQAELNANENNTIALCGYYKDVNLAFTQSSALTSLTSCINKNVISTIDNNTVINEMVQETDAKFASRQQGPLTGGDSLIKTIAIIAAIIVGLLIIAGVIVAIVVEK